MIDYLAKLLQSRGETSAKHFDRIVTPTYEIAEKIVQNYLQLFSKLREMVAAGVSREEIARFIETGRLEYLPARMRLREVLERDELWQGGSDNLFIHAISGILAGGLSTYEDRQIGISYVKTGHTLLDVLYRLHDPRASLTVSLHRYIDIQDTAVREAWADATKAYVEMQSQIATSGHITLGSKRRRDR